MIIKLKKDQHIRIYTAQDLYPIMQKILLHESPEDRVREHIWVVGLNFGLQILNIELIAMGTNKAVITEPMEVFSIPLQKKASKIILVHNHPSGLLEPSSKDINLTDQMIQVGKIVKIPVIDHLIITEKKYFSFKDAGLLDEIAKSDQYVPDFVKREKYQKIGRESGTETGRKEREKEIVRSMRAEGIELETIAKITGLTVATIKRIKD